MESVQILIILLLQYSNNLCRQYLQWTSNEGFMVLWLRALTNANI